MPQNAPLIPPRAAGKSRNVDPVSESPRGHLAKTHPKPRARAEITGKAARERRHVARGGRWASSGVPAPRPGIFRGDDCSAWRLIIAEAGGAEGDRPRAERALDRAREQN